MESKPGVWWVWREAFDTLQTENPTRNSSLWSLINLKIPQELQDPTRVASNQPRQSSISMTRLGMWHPALEADLQPGLKTGHSPNWYQLKKTLAEHGQELKIMIINIGSIWLSLSQSLLSTFLVWIRNDVWPSTTHAMALYRRAGLPALAAWEARQFGHLLNEKRPKPPNPRGMVLAGLQVWPRLTMMDPKWQKLHSQLDPSWQYR